MSPQFCDERSQAARQVAPLLRTFVRYSTLLVLAQVVLVAALLVGIFLKKTEAFGVTQSGAVFKLELVKK